MEHITPTGKSVEEYIKQFVVKKHNVQNNIEDPTNTTVQPMLDTVNKNLIGMLDDRDNMYRK